MRTARVRGLRRVLRGIWQAALTGQYSVTRGLKFSVLSGCKLTNGGGARWQICKVPDLLGLSLQMPSEALIRSGDRWAALGLDALLEVSSDWDAARLGLGSSQVTSESPPDQSQLRL